MATDIEKVSGIGPATAAFLRSQGISSAEDLAGITVEQVAALKGFSTTRAEQVVTAAQQLLTPAASDSADEPAAGTKEKKKKDKDKKADKDKKKDKKKDKDPGFKL